MKLSAVVNTYNEATNIVRCLASVSPYVDEIIVVDMESTDKTRELARKYTNKIFKHPKLSYVEPARNFAIQKAKNEWIFLIDADEVLPEQLGLKLRQLITQEYSFYRIPRKNIVFGNWLKHSGWWPDYQIRLFHKGGVEWNDEIHSIPITRGKGMDLPAHPEEALSHDHYQTVEQYIERLNRYTSQEAQELIAKQIPFEWKNLIRKPMGEFLTRFFAWEGYKDGVHGLSLSLLQSFSMLIVQLKLWQHSRFTPHTPDSFLDSIQEETQKASQDLHYWYHETKQQNAHGLQKTVHKIRSKIRL